MAHESKHRESPSTRCGKRVTASASSVPALRDDKISPVGFYSLDQPDAEEAVLRAALENAGDFAWRRLEPPADAQGLMPSASEVACLRLDAVIVVLNTSEIADVEPLFARLRLGDPQRPILGAPRGLTADGIYEVLSRGDSAFLFPPY